MQGALETASQTKRLRLRFPEERNVRQTQHYSPYLDHCRHTVRPIAIGDGEEYCDLIIFCWGPELRLRTALAYESYKVC